MADGTATPDAAASGQPLDASVSTPAPATTPAPSSPPKDIKTPLGATLAAVPSNADAFLAHLARCLQGRGTADTVLLFLTYVCRFNAAALETASRSALRHSARKLVALAFKLPPSTTVVLSSAPAPPLATAALSLANRFKALAGVLAEWRTMNRLWGLVGMYFATKKLVAARSVKDPEKTSTQAQLDTAVSVVQVASLISFHTAESVAYLSSKKVLHYTPATQGKLALWSVRSWGLYVFLEIAKHLVERSRKARAGAAARDPAWAAQWQKSFLRNLAWAPLTVQWGLPNGPLPDIVVAMLGLYPAVGEMKDLWKSTAA